jgi:hypothetical protein
MTERVVGDSVKSGVTCINEPVRQDIGGILIPIVGRGTGQIRHRLFKVKILKLLRVNDGSGRQ